MILSFEYGTEILLSQTMLTGKIGIQIYAGNTLVPTTTKVKNFFLITDAHSDMRISYTFLLKYIYKILLFF